jgi:DNA polymerase III delta prime subunit
MKELLLTERWRPKDIDDIILLPRIKKIFTSGLTQNVILYGHYGTGKTTLARILIGKYSKSKPHLEINSSFYTSIDTLRTKIDDFCSKVYMGFDMTDEISQDSMKYVFLDEFERTSTQYQDALKVYIEEYSTKGVRFIFNTNHIDKISDGIKSRITQINFDCQNAEEEKFLKRSIYTRIIDKIAPKENIDITREDLIRIINRNFPDFRATLNELQHFKETGQISNGQANVNLKLRNDLFSIIYDTSKTYEDIYHFVMDNFGPEKISEMVNLFGRNFIQWSFEEKRENIDKLFMINYIIADNLKNLESEADPIIVGMCVIGKIRDLVISK